jgi:hypothetical protein
MLLEGGCLNSLVKKTRSSANPTRAEPGGFMGLTGGRPV